MPSWVLEFTGYSSTFAELPFTRSSEAEPTVGRIIPNGPTVTVSLETPPGRDAKLRFDGVAGQYVSAKGVLTNGSMSCLWGAEGAQARWHGASKPERVVEWRGTTMERLLVHGEPTASPTLVLTEVYKSRDEALAREKQLKRWTRRKKEALIAGNVELSTAVFSATLETVNTLLTVLGDHPVNADFTF